MDAFSSLQGHKIADIREKCKLTTDEKTYIRKSLSAIQSDLHPVQQSNTGQYDNVLLNDLTDTNSTHQVSMMVIFTDTSFIHKFSMMIYFVEIVDACKSKSEVCECLVSSSIVLNHNAPEYDVVSSPSD